MSRPSPEQRTIRPSAAMRAVSVGRAPAIEEKMLGEVKKVTRHFHVQTYRADEKSPSSHTSDSKIQFFREKFDSVSHNFPNQVAPPPAPSSSQRSDTQMYLVKDIGGAIGLMAAALVLLGTWPIGGDTPETPNFLTQLAQPQDYWPSIMFALAGGVVITLGTVATQYGWAYVGLSVTEVMASSLKVVIGTTLNYFLDGRINRAEVLFPGVGCFLIAACLGSLVHSSNAADNQEKLSNSRNYSAGNTAKEDLTQHLLQEEEEPKDCEEAKPALPNNKAVEKAEAGTADFLIDLEDKRSIKVLGSNTLVGLAIVTFAGVCYSLFAPAFNLATNDQWHTLRDGLTNLVGSASPFMPGQAAGYAAADSVQALPLVSTLWGVVLFGEYRRSSRRTYTLLGSMLFMFVVAMAVLMASSAHRKPL
ncbi:hypothetical protein TRIUR3_03714 [Triticum urartu]|uniref:Ureide permease 2 n=1 Tax=Triticum urartu TaxID=4572 RepID=M7YJH3_TRIUA|nr:hypothetical protein TRIUR3_03714 [Triticum urartu]